MRRFLLILSLSVLSCGICLSAVPKEFSDLLEKSCANRVTVGYSFVIEQDGVPLEGRGLLVVEGECYSISSEEMDVMCDGVTLWIADKSSRELYIEDAPSASEFRSNPDEYFGLFKELKVLSSEVSPASKSLAGFRYPVAELDSSWSVNDLR